MIPFPQVPANEELRPMSQTPKVVVGTLTWNQKAHVLECLRSLVQLDYPRYEIVVVDNGSTDGTYEAVRAQFPTAHIVRHPENLGCAEGVNGEIRYAQAAGADYLFIIANDAVVQPSTLSELVRVAQTNPSIGIVFPKVYYYGTQKKIWMARGIKWEGINWLRGRFEGLIQNVEDDGRYDEQTDATLGAGGFCLVRLEAVKKAGLLNPDYWIYYDDAEWLMRIRKAGYSGRYAPRAVAWHKPSSAMGMETEAFYYYRTRNRLTFFKQFSPPGVFPLFFLYFLWELFSDTLPCLFLSHRRPQMKTALQGVLDFLRGRKGAQDFGSEKMPFYRRFAKKVAGTITSWVRKVRFGIKHLAGQKVFIQVDLNWNIGDEILTLPVFEALKKKFPHSQIDVETRHPELLMGNPYVDFVNQKDRWHPDLILDLHREARGKKHRLEYISEMAGVPRMGVPKVYLTQEEIERSRKKWPRNGETCRIALSARAQWFFARQWPIQKWMDLAQYFMREHHAQIFVLGKHVEPLPVGIDLIGKTDLREAAALLSQCDLLVAQDSGILHLALAVGTPSVGLFGPLDPSQLIADRPEFLPVYTEVECRGCWSEGRMKHRDHCFKIIPDCMSSISLERVIEAGERMLKRRESHLEKIGYAG